MATTRVLVIGGGVFGTAGALALAKRGHSVVLLDPGPLPHPDASSTDISKVIRMDYGADVFYMSLMERAMDGWRAWNDTWERPLFHETGFLLLTPKPMEAGEYEFESFRLLQARGHRPERITPDLLAERFPAWSEGGYVDGYFNPEAGWAESGEVVRHLLASARQAGVVVRDGTRVIDWVMDGGSVRGVVAEGGGRLEADAVVTAAGAWTAKLLPWLSDRIQPIGQPVLHFKAQPVASYQPPHFVPWAADIARTGWYGFAALDDGTLKIANHGPGRRVDPDSKRNVGAEAEPMFRGFLNDALPGLSNAKLIGTRLCLYSDTWDGDFYVDQDPDHPGLIVASGGSGHGFKFAPVMGDLIADVVESRENPRLKRFAWRQRGDPGHEEARHIGD
jgi:glycine/D-amino acid oxidase-like deaminating enzyme